MVDGPIASLVPPGETQDNARNFSAVYSDPDFFEVLDLKPLAGRGFSADREVDFLKTPEDEIEPLTRGAVLNEAGLEFLGFSAPADAVGQVIIMPGGGRNTLVTIVGVVPDAHLDSLYSKIKPTIFFVTNSPRGFILLDIRGGQREAVLSEVKQVWGAFSPPFCDCSDFFGR